MTLNKEIEERILAVARAAEDWRDPEYAPRAEAVGETLDADNTFTEEAVAFAVNQQMSLLEPRAMKDWLGGRASRKRRNVGVLNAGNVPLVGLQDFLAVVLTGHDYSGTTSSRSPILLPAFVDDVRRRCPSLVSKFLDVDRLFTGADAIIATGSDETRQWVHEQCAAHDIPEERRLVRGHRFAVAVLDGTESDVELEHLAEDALLHEGFGCRNVALIWVPAGMPPDDFLTGMAHYRAVFPAHESTPGRLKMQQAFLEAVDQPHAYGEGLEFLLSKGEPEVQQPGHIRWTEYAHEDEVNSWMQQNAGRIQLVVAQPDVARRLSVDLPVVVPGGTQRPPLNWRPDGRDSIDFLVSLD